MPMLGQQSVSMPYGISYTCCCREFLIMNEERSGKMIFLSDLFLEEPGHEPPAPWISKAGVSQALSLPCWPCPALAGGFHSSHLPRDGCFSFC